MKTAQGTHDREAESVANFWERVRASQRRDADNAARCRCAAPIPGEKYNGATGCRGCGKVIQ